MKSFRGWLATLAAVALALGGTACSKQEETTERAERPSRTKVNVSIEPVEVVQASLPPSAAMASLGTTLAVNQYIQARLLTEEVITGDFTASNADDLLDTLDEAILAWDNTAEVSMGASDLTSVAEENLKGSSSKEKSERRSRDRSEQDWTEPFSKAADPYEVVKAQSDLLADIQDDIDELAFALGDIEDLLSAGSRASKSDLRDAEDVAKDMERLPIVDLWVTSSALPKDGSVGELSGSKSRGRSSDRVILTGVDAIAMVGPESSSLMVGANKQVVLQEKDLPTDASEVDVVLGIVNIAPDTDIDVSKDVPPVAVPIGRTPSAWIPSKALFSIQVDVTNVDVTLVLAEIPTDAEEAGLEGLDVPIQAAPDITLIQLVNIIQINVDEAIFVIDDMSEELEPPPVEEAPAEKEKETPKQQEPAQQPATVPSMSGTYSYTMDGMDGASSGSAQVSLSGSDMVIDFGGGPIYGFFDTSTNTFWGSADVFELIITFYPNSSPIYAEGTSSDGFTQEFIYMTKTG